MLMPRRPEFPLIPLPFEPSEAAPKSSFVRVLLGVLQRQRRTALIVFASVLVGWLVAASTAPKQYEADMKILVLHNRAEPSVSPDRSAVSQAPEVSEEEINSEVELMRSRDSLLSVIEICGLDKVQTPSLKQRVKGWLHMGGRPATAEARRAAALALLDRDLKIRTLKKTNMIQASYTSTNPDVALNVLQALTRLYFQKHVEVHRIPGAYDFFTQEADRFRGQLANDAKEMTAFAMRNKVGSAADERDETMRKLVGFEAEMRQMQADISEKTDRLASINTQLRETPERIKTQERRSDNPVLLQQLKSSLLERQLKRTQLATTFKEDYPTIRELDREIGEIQTALNREENAPVVEETRDQAPSHTFLMQELAQTKADLASRQGEASALDAVIRDYRNRVAELEQVSIQEQDLNRTQKSDEASYLLYRSKLEDTRISDALDRKNIVNVAVAEPPIRPPSPSNLSLLLETMLGAILATFVAVGIAWAVDSVFDSFRTPEEVEQVLLMPLLAYIPGPQGLPWPAASAVPEA